MISETEYPDHPGFDARDCGERIKVDAGYPRSTTMSGYACAITGGHCKGNACTIKGRHK
jgi:hypothetical protein